MRGRSLALVLALVILAIAVHASALSGFWLYDDPVLLVESIRQPALSVLFNPAEYTHLSATTFTPLLLLSFKFDRLLHGLDPRVFYAHQLVAMIAAVLLLYFLLRQYVSDLYAAAGAAVVLTAWPAVYAVRTLMIRHYVEGLLFAFAAMLAWRRSKTLASFFYLLAMLSKEVYAPIPLFFIAQSIYEQMANPPAARHPLPAARAVGAGRVVAGVARDLIGPVIAAIVFIVWRWRMTGLIGGYSHVAPAANLATLPRTLWVHMTGPDAPVWAQAMWAIFIVAALGSFIWRFRLRAIGFLLLAAIVLFLPIVSLTANFEWRYSFAFISFLVPILILSLGTSSRPWAIVFPAMVAITTVITSDAQRRNYEQMTRSGIAVEGQYVWNEPPNAPALAATSPAWYTGSLRWLRNFEHRGFGPRVAFSAYAITTGAMDPAHMVAVDNGRIVPLTSTPIFGTPADWQRARMQLDPNLPLSIEFALRNYDAQWRFAPPAARFVFVTDPDYAATPVPASGAQRLPSPRDQQFFRIVREQADGRWTISPALPIPAQGHVTMWQSRKLQRGG